jgi:hypothetical protein
MKLVLIDPLSCHHISTRRPRNKSPSTIVNQSLELICHGRSPIRVSKGAAIIGRNRRSNKMISRQIPVVDRQNGSGLKTGDASKDRRWR